MIDNSFNLGKLMIHMRKRGLERLIHREVSWVHAVEREVREERETGPAKNLRL